MVHQVGSQAVQAVHPAALGLVGSGLFQGHVEQIQHQAGAGHHLPGVDGVVHQALDGAHGLGGQGLLGADGVVHDDAVHAGVEKTRDHRGGDHEQDRVGDDQLVLQFEIVSIMMQQPCKWVLHESIFSLYSDGDRPTIFRKVLL